MAPQENRFNIAQGYHKEKGEKSPHPFNKILFLCTLANLQHNSQQGHSYKHLHNHELNQHLGKRIFENTRILKNRKRIIFSKPIPPFTKMMEEVAKIKKGLPLTSTHTPM